jgi:hypothetical protein
MTMARIINFWRHHFRHPAAITRRAEAARARDARKRADAPHRARVLSMACRLRIEIARAKFEGPDA